METIEEIVENESRRYHVGSEQCRELLDRMDKKAEQLRISEDARGSNIQRVGSVTRFCANPYNFLLKLTEAYEGAKEIVQAQEIISSLYWTYESKRKFGDEQRFTEDEIETTLYVLTEKSLRII